MAESLVDVLMRRDELSREDAEGMISEAQDRVLDGEDPEVILYEEFGLEPDYIFDLIPGY